MFIGIGKMRECREKKRLQIYLDGWLDETEAYRFESHLKTCDECQTALMELEEISASALEIVDHAPEREYWDSFFNRVQNRIFARDLSPYVEKSKSSLRLKIASYSVGIMSVAAVFLLTFGYLSNFPIDNDPIGTAPVEDQVISAEQPVIESPAIDLPININEVSDNSEAGEKLENTVSVTEAIAERSDSPSEIAAVDNSGDIAAIDEAVLLPEQTDYRSAFRSPLRITPTSLSLSDDENFVTRLLVEYGGLSMDDFSISPNVVAEGILSGYASGAGGTLTGSPDGSLLDGSAPSAGDAVYPRWGYLGVPFDSSKIEGLQRYMIELELTRVK